MMEDKKEKVLDAANVVEAKAMSAIDNVEKSSLGSSIPLEVSLPLRELTKYLMLFTIFESIPVYLISCEENKNEFLHWISRGTGFIFLIIAIMAAALDIVTFYGKMFNFYKFVVPVTLVKTALAFLVIVFSNISSIYVVFLAVLYSLRIALFDALFLYYLAILLRRIESDEYDNNGERIRTKDEKGEKV
ncbi:DUF5090 domain-containing protein [Encephalitozoon hellem]|uniref:DUF5090 domain-containing protein n=1 Tax=Encephalitozoon hellem TaxID=27973 RepID=A0A9Q9CCU9_ENCHE|nr:uncharacterized protein EHEL_070470 [Encephalitozoon hellem ATCC 50504]AFM98574.1 hypothetical protein EHEL_070470 [Encephalitozoon hellem ATCC 50504]KAG5858629.1 DUF5090 domain-containing protein [Encephalitozoon hellem]UTX43518.1 DUF5090 domain-containing protein [Encephalitozoon hellem]WEL38992.1 DUF5090 domain-containing protein [Encephalitozoon hellem]|eukprot:XP_003887555.1 hypothetical protein EHEL_070470 [Encephalitozoon hellem ATCC 50504]